MQMRPFWSRITEDEKCDRIYIHSNPTRRERVLLANSFDKLTSIIHWIEHEVSRMHLFNHLYIHSSILTRIYEELSGGSLAYCEAHTIAFIPFPFLFAQVLSYALYTFSVLCPFIVQASLGEQEGGLEQGPLSWPALAIMNVLLVAGFAGLNEIATELEDPFTEKLNNFPLRVLQRRVDCTLESVADIGLPKDFSLANFGEESNAMAEASRDAAMRSALGTKSRSRSDPASGPLASVVNACEELRLAIAGCVRDIAKDSRQARQDASELELQSCQAAYRLLLAQGSSPPAGAAAGANASGSSMPGRGASSLKPLDLPPPGEEEEKRKGPGRGGISGGEAARGEQPADGSSQPWDKDELRRLLEESARVNGAMSPLLIQEVCFGRRRSRSGCG